MILRHVGWTCIRTLCRKGASVVDSATRVIPKSKRVDSLVRAACAISSNEEIEDIAIAAVLIENAIKLARGCDEAEANQLVPEILEMIGAHRERMPALVPAADMVDWSLDQPQPHRDDADAAIEAAIETGGAAPDCRDISDASDRFTGQAGVGGGHWGLE